MVGVRLRKKTVLRRTRILPKVRYCIIIRRLSCLIHLRFRSITISSKNMISSTLTLQVRWKYVGHTGTFGSDIKGYLKNEHGVVGELPKSVSAPPVAAPIPATPAVSGYEKPPSGMSEKYVSKNGAIYNWNKTSGAFTGPSSNNYTPEMIQKFAMHPANEKGEFPVPTGMEETYRGANGTNSNWDKASGGWVNERDGEYTSINDAHKSIENGDFKSPEKPGSEEERPSSKVVAPNSQNAVHLLLVKALVICRCLLRDQRAVRITGMPISRSTHTKPVMSLLKNR